MTCTCNQCQALDNNIRKCQTEIDELMSGHNPLPFKGETAESILEERIEHLQHLKTTLEFIRDKPFTEINL